MVLRHNRRGLAQEGISYGASQESQKVEKGRKGGERRRAAKIFYRDAGEVSRGRSRGTK